MGVFACPTCDRLYPNPVRQRVFCASLADVFEDRPELEDWRRDLFDMVLATPHLDWLLLTKRPENIVQMTSLHNFSQGLPSNIWLGTSVENQETADERIPHLLKVPATVHFISMEPLLGPVDLGPALYKNGVHKGGIYYQRIDWIIVGGESGPNARPMHPEWVRSIRDQCIASGTPFHFKQWGEWMPCTAEEYAVLDDSKRCFWGPYIGLDGWRCGPLPRLWDGVAPKSIQITTMARVGKKAAGRLLGVQEWNEYPEEIAQ
jgi:protein gp37